MPIGFVVTRGPAKGTSALARAVPVGDPLMIKSIGDSGTESRLSKLCERGREKQPPLVPFFSPYSVGVR